MAAKVFQLGLVMAGAVSAGAYTAGVMDFLIEALDEFERAKADPAWNGPRHDVKLPVLAGASAGGMTAGIAALEAHREFQHLWPGQPFDPKKNRFYSSWVTDISIEELLETTDLVGARLKDGVVSFLCSDVLDRIVRNVFASPAPQVERAWLGGPAEEALKVILTVTNLRGVPYEFALLGTEPSDKYGMLNHADYLDFEVGKNAGAPRPIKPDALIGPTAELFETACLATGAFPAGLAPRPLNRAYGDYGTQGQVVCELPGGGSTTIPADDEFCTKNADFAFVAVDGGVIDNEPLELARRVLLAGEPGEKANGQGADRAVILIDPFPNLPVFPPENPALQLVNVLPQLLPTLIDQARFKPAELALAVKHDVFSRFMIAPVPPSGVRARRSRSPPDHNPKRSTEMPCRP